MCESSTRCFTDIFLCIYANGLVHNICNTISYFGVIAEMPKFIIFLLWPFLCLCLEFIKLYAVSSD